jgi:hypothetical protein
MENDTAARGKRGERTVLPKGRSDWAVALSPLGMALDSWILAGRMSEGLVRGPAALIRVALTLALLPAVAVLRRIGIWHGLRCGYVLRPPALAARGSHLEELLGMDRALRTGKVQAVEDGDPSVKNL